MTHDDDPRRLQPIQDAITELDIGEVRTLTPEEGGRRARGPRPEDPALRVRPRRLGDLEYIASVSSRAYGKR